MDISLNLKPGCKMDKKMQFTEIFIWCWKIISIIRGTFRKLNANLS